MLRLIIQHLETKPTENGQHETCTLGEQGDENSQFFLVTENCTRKLH